MTEKGSARDSHLDGAGQALFALVRFWARRWLPGALPSQEERLRAQHLLAVEAIASAHGITAPGEVTVNDLARELHVDQSNASRLAAQAEREGLVSRERSATDGRAAILSLTARGRELLRHSHTHQDAVFRDLVAEWSARDQARMATYLRALRNGQPPPPE